VRFHSKRERSAEPLNLPFLLVGNVAISSNKYAVTEGLDIVPCPSSERALGLLRAGTCYQAVFSDLSISDADGIEFVQRVCREFPELPVVIVTEPQDIKFGIMAMLFGASDCIQKPVHPSLILASLNRARRRKHIERNSMRRETEEELRACAF